MKRKKITSIIAVIMAVLLLLSLIVSVIPIGAFAVDMSEIEQLKAQKSALAYQVQQSAARLTALQEQQSNVLLQKAAFDEQRKLASAQLKLIAKEIDKYDELIEEKGKELDAAKNREAIQLERYRTRIRAMEENGNYDLISVLLKAESFSQLLTAMDDIGQIMKSDRKLHDLYIEAREETELVKAQYEEEKAEYESSQDKLKLERQEINNQISENEKTLESLDGEIVKAIKEYEAAEAAEQQASAEIQRAITAYNAEHPVVQSTPSSAAGGTTTSSSAGSGVASNTSFVWPVPSSSRVTSLFGNRSDPFTGSSANHTGLDIDGFGNDGGDVVSAAGGTVVTVGYNEGYGNYVVVNHGNNTSTLYAHLSGSAVSEGQSIGQGQTLGYLGSTGRATGTHLHFEVYEGDTRVDPDQFFSGQTYYNC